MFKQLYYSTALALLPSAESVVRKFETLVKQLDTTTTHIEGYLEEKAVALAKNSQHRRSAVQSLMDVGTAIYATVAHLVDTVENAFFRREQAIIKDISKLRTKLDAASEARDAVAKLIGK